MKATEIPRVSFEGDFKDERVALALEAKAKLGYSKLANAIGIPTTLAFQLRELGICPLVTSDVLRYQDSKTSKGMLSSTKQFIWLAVGLSLLLGALATGLSDRPAAHWSPMHYAITTALASLAVLNMLAVLARLATGIDGGTRNSVAWEHDMLETYDGNVPEHALAKAVALAKNVPDVRFTVEYLVKRKEAVIRRLPDPFLRATLLKTGESFYIDVWDEKEYEGRL